MKTKKSGVSFGVCAAVLPVLFAVLALVACSAYLEKEFEWNDDGDNSGGRSGSKITTSNFYAVDLTTNTYYSLKADLLAEGNYCKIWVEQASKQYFTAAGAKKLAAEYDSNIYGKMLACFDIGKVNVDDNTTVGNILAAADWLTDGDGKLSILMLDIRDGYTPQSGSYTAGYFSPANFYKDGGFYRSNQKDMVYMDTYPAKPGSTESCQTLAHELQHLMNFITSFVVRVDGNKVNLMDTWVDEGLSSAAEYLYLGSQVEGRCAWFASDPMGTIATGNNFFVWGNRNGTSILDDYSTGYLFFQWLRIQAGSTGIYKKIISSQHPDYRAVTDAAKEKISWFGGGTWDTLFESWLAANYINAGSEAYGYLNDSRLKQLHAKSAPSGTHYLDLLPGEAVYSKTATATTTASYRNTDSGTHIKYVGLDKNGSVDANNTYADGALLTYNSNTDNQYGSVNDLVALKEKGYLTGVAEQTVTQSGARLARSSSIGGTKEEPVRIDARDMLARNGAGGALGIPGRAYVLNNAMLNNAMLKNATFSIGAGDE
ncbi:MAG: hypothetical protein LBO04_03355 [Spirochaetaceae bacterium]|jgi:hypothetical protein|nr:hypothetical protein [Spirochaetaceae bacterium]